MTDTDTIKPDWSWSAPQWAVVILMALVIPLLTARTDKPGEFYPFSNYPMYDSFESTTYYVFVSDGADKPVAIGTNFGIASSDVKKSFDRKLIEAKRKSGTKVKRADLPMEVQTAAGREVLEWLKASAPVINKDRIASIGTLRLHRVDITFKDGHLSKNIRLVGEVPTR